MHGYDHSAIDPARRFFYHRPYNSQTVRRYNIDTQTWTSLPSLPFADYNNCCDALEYFPELDGIVWIASNGLAGQNNGHVYLYKEATNQWTVLSSTVDLSDTWTLAQYNPVHKLMLFYSAGTGALYKMSGTGAITKLRNPPVSLYNGSNGLLTVDPVSGDYIALTGSSLQPYKYDVLTDTWQVLSAANQPSFTGSGVVATPINTYGAIFFATCDGGGGSNCTAYLYKHAAGTGTTTAPPPATPTVNISANPASVLSRPRFHTVLEFDECDFMQRFRRLVRCQSSLRFTNHREPLCGDDIYPYLHRGRRFGQSVGDGRDHRFDTASDAPTEWDFYASRKIRKDQRVEYVWLERMVNRHQRRIHGLSRHWSWRHDDRSRG